MKPNRLLLRFLMGYIGVGLLGLLAFYLYVPGSIINYARLDTANSLYTEAINLADTYGNQYYNQNLTTEELYSAIDLYGRYLHADIWMISLNGSTVAYHSDSGVQAPSSISDFDPNALFGSENYANGTFYNYFPEEYLSVYSPITVRYNIKGYVFIHVPLSYIDSTVQHYIEVAIIQSILVYSASYLVLFILIATVIIPLKRMRIIAREYSYGNFKPVVPKGFNDDLSYVGDVMSFMANKLDVHEDEQRRFISNVSHDFRSPLTSIRGYLQAMLDGTVPPEKFEKYHKILLNEADRLTGLTNRLLDLNRIGSRDAVLELSDFDINTIITDCAASAEVQAVSKNVNIYLVLTGESFNVNADMAKIQQVIYNLLDNAIKFSKENSTITIETTRRSDKLMVSVKDEGIGIPKESLDNIWNRFYKTDLSRGQDKKGTGLGLSIVKEIIQAHNETIDVVSTVGVGTTFIFSLTPSEEELENI